MKREGTEIGRVSSVFTDGGVVRVNVQLSRAGAEVRNIPFQNLFPGAMITPQEGDIVEVYRLRDGSRAARFAYNRPEFELPTLEQNELHFQWNDGTKLSVRKDGDGSYTVTIAGDSEVSIESESSITVDAPDVNLGGVGGEPVARVGDSVEVQSADGTLSGEITDGSDVVSST